MYFERLYVCIIRIRRIGYLLFLDVERPTVPVKWVPFYVYFVLVATNLMNRTRNKKFRRSRCEHSQYSSFLGSTVRKLVCHSTSYFQQITIGICERTNNDPSQKRNVSTILFQEKNCVQFSSAVFRPINNDKNIRFRLKSTLEWYSKYVYDEFCGTKTGLETATCGCCQSHETIFWTNEIIFLCSLVAAAIFNSDSLLNAENC